MKDGAKALLNGPVVPFGLRHMIPGVGRVQNGIEIVLDGVKHRIKLSIPMNKFHIVAGLMIAAHNRSQMMSILFVALAC